METLMNSAIRLAIEYADEKNKKGLLIKLDNPLFIELMTNGTENGDAETIYSITSLYADNINNDDDWEDKILDALIENYPDFA